MMHHWPWWLGGVALASIALAHWLFLGRQLAISGRFTALVNRWRFGAGGAGAANASSEELVRALRAMTAQEFGPASLEEPADAVLRDSLPQEAPVLKQRQSSWAHVAFLSCLLLGGLLSALVAGDLEVAVTLGSGEFTRIFGAGLGGPLALLGGGLLVGFGTRMAAGCTSGHGLCGVSRFQSGSLLATACFFGMGILVSFALGALP
jgi:hypothetical protein